ncbi:WD40 repeat-like protein [Calocera viscosa TUFC12733]|uniref:WD40 repeat-like protein n=1 Tax=Calocera viscosa (strain TUFC12733) TaxID=1330018 RepID=A0A167MFZ2_CALVF|nr:WD40 repeat-like protein [Calocera viscosa TUFC12733]
MAEPLLNGTPSTVTPAIITSHHRELRDLLVCPEERGQVHYIRGTSLFSQDVLAPEFEPEQLCDLRFHPVCLSYGAGLLAAGGLHSELALRPLHSSRWTYTTKLSKSINNSLFVTSTTLPDDAPSGSRTRLFVSNNDHTLTSYEVWIEEDGEGEGGCRMELSGSVRLTTALNHASLSPDGRTMLVVGDTPEVFVLNVSGGPSTTMKVTTTLEAADASFSTAWSPDGRKFAVSSQNGQVMVWDVRSTKPLAKFTASRASASTRAVKFTPAGAPQELLTFAEGSSILHVVDARTFDTHETYALPPINTPTCPTLTRTKRFIGDPSQPAPDTTIPIRRSFTPAHLLLSSFHLAHYAPPSSPPPRPHSRGSSYTTSALYTDLGDYKPPVPWYASGYGSNTDPEITGLCWDPTGRWCYVGTEGSIVEWSVAREQRTWWDDVEFA